MSRKNDVIENTDYSPTDDLDQSMMHHPTHSVHIDYEKRYCPQCKKLELRSECKYGPRYWDMFSMPEKLSDKKMKEEKDYEYEMARNQLQTAEKAIQRLMKHLKGEGNLPAWVQSKITLGVDYIDTVADYMDGEINEETSCTKCKKSKCMCGTHEPEEYDPNKLKEVGEAVKLDPSFGNIISVIISWRGKTYMNKMFFPQVKLPTRRDVIDQIQKVYPGASVLSYNVSGLEPGQPLIQVYDPQKSKNYLLNNKTIGEENVTEVAAWQRKEGKNQSGGLNEKGRKSYERENPGSDLKAPSKKVGNPRRASFCARMKGMKAKLTSAKTARDPDSRINKSLRAWNC